MVVTPVHTHEPEEVLFLNGPCAGHLFRGYSDRVRFPGKDTQARLGSVEHLVGSKGVKRQQGVVMEQGGL